MTARLHTRSQRREIAPRQKPLLQTYATSSRRRGHVFTSSASTARRRRRSRVVVLVIVVLVIVAAAVAWFWLQSTASSRTGAQHAPVRLERTV